MSADEARTITRRDGTPVELATFLVSDETERYMQVKVWGHQTKQMDGARVGDIVLFHEFDLSRFREVTSATSKSRSCMRVVARAHPHEAAVLEPGGSGGTDHERKEAYADQQQGNKRQKTHDSFQLVRSHSAASLPSRTSNWSDIVSSAKSLMRWSMADGYDLLYRAPETVATAGGLNLSSTAAFTSASAQLAPPRRTTSLAALVAGTEVTVTARLRCCQSMRILPSSFGGATATAPPSVMLVVLLSESAEEEESHPTDPTVESAACHEEVTVELELRQAMWRSDAWRHFWRESQGRQLRVENVRAQWHPHAEAIVLTDTARTVISLASLHPPVAPAASTLPSLDLPSSTAAPPPPPPLPSPLVVESHQGWLVSLEFPLLTLSDRTDLHRHLRRHDFPSSSPPPLPRALFTRLCYAACTRCGVELRSDPNGVYSCLACLTSHDRASQLRRHLDHAARLTIRWRWRDAIAHVRPKGTMGDEARCGVDQPSTLETTTIALTLSHAQVSDLFANIEPTCLVDAGSVITCTPPTVIDSTQGSVIVDTQTGAAPSHSLVPCSPSAFPRLSLRFQWYRLFLALTDPDVTDSGSHADASAHSLPSCSYHLAPPSAAFESPPHLRATHFSLWSDDTAGGDS